MLSNCKECGHVVDSGALECPKCGAPKKTGNLKNCIQCGREIESRKRKCPYCAEQQYNNSSTSTSSMNKKSSKANIYLPAMFLILGAFIMYISYPKINPPTEPSLRASDASVLSIDGYLVFIQSQPKIKPNILGKLTEANIIEIAQQVKDAADNKEKKFFGNLLDALTTARQNFNFRERIEGYAKAAQQQYPNSNALIINGADLKEVTVVQIIE